MLRLASIVTKDSIYEVYGVDKNDVRRKFVEQISNEACYIGEYTANVPFWNNVKYSEDQEWTYYPVGIVELD